jgi:predicted dehydrogenase
MKQVRVAIIGQGRSGRCIHAAHFVMDQPDKFKIIAVVDSLKERRDFAIREYSCEAYADYRELFKRDDIDLVVNASFSHMHYPITLDLLKHGFNVLCEKPLVKKVKEVDNLMAAARKHKKVLAIFQQARFAPYFRQVQNVINSGLLGRIVQISIRFNNFGRRWDWQTLKEYNGGNLLNTGPHPLDQALVLFGDGMPEVHCWMDKVLSFGNAEDHVKLILSGKGHPLIDIEISSCCAYPTFTYLVYGSRGSLKGTTEQMEWKYFKPSEAPKRKLIKQPLSDENGVPAYCGETLTWHTDTWPVSINKKENEKEAEYSSATAAQSNMAEDFYNMLYGVLCEGKKLQVTPEQVRRQMAVVEECHKQNPHIYKQ